MNTATRVARHHFPPLPAPRLDDWVATWLPARLAADSTMARYRSMLRAREARPFAHRQTSISGLPKGELPAEPNSVRSYVGHATNG